MITIVAERINMTRKSIREKVWERNRDFIVNEVQTQEAAGATHIDINAGADPARECEDMIWLTEVVRDATELPISFDSASAEVLEAGLGICNRPGTIINSTTLEQDRINNTLPLVKAFNTGIIILTMDDSGMPEDLARRTTLVDRIVALASQEQIGLDRVYIDTLVRPVSTNPEQISCIIDSVRYIKQTYPEAHTMVGLSNVSFGIPKRIHVNRAFFVMLLEAGLDGAIIDPCADGMMGIMYSTHALLGQDEFCMNYITAHQEGRL
jgi:5-methyltetrahydrofolate--homocysteine methyltransferase